VVTDIDSLLIFLVKKKQQHTHHPNWTPSYRTMKQKSTRGANIARNQTAKADFWGPSKKKMSKLCISAGPRDHTNRELQGSGACRSRAAGPYAVRSSSWRGHPARPSACRCPLRPHSTSRHQSSTGVELQ
jgi:hypothetical protein